MLATGRKQRILFVNNTGHWGGAEKVFYLLLKYLDRSRFDAHVLLGGHGELVSRVEALGLPVEVLSDSRWPAPPRTRLGRAAWLSGAANALLRAAGAVRAMVERNGIDLVHANNQQSIAYCSLGLLGTATPLIWHEHIAQPNALRKLAWSGLAHLAASRVITVSQAMASTHCWPGSRKLTVVHNGIEPQEEASEPESVRTAFGIPADAPIVTIPAVLRRWKGHEVFLRAAELVRARCPEVLFLVVGDEVLAEERGYRAQLEALAQQLGLEDRCFFTGFSRDVPAILAESEIVVSATTRWEPFGLIAVEAMRAGRPVVATRVGGIPEIVAHGVTGLLVEPNSPEALAEALCSLLRSPEERRRMGEAGQRLFFERFGVERFAGEIQRVYAEVLNRSER